MQTELIPANQFTPEPLRDCDYYPGNDAYIKKEMEMRQAIIELQKDVEPWKAKAAEHYAKEPSIPATAKKVRKTGNIVRDALRNEFQVLQLLHHWQALHVLMDGPNKAMRKQMLWRIAVDNETSDPKESIKALAELNRMTQAPGHSGGFNIVINNAVLPRGPLDG